MRAAGVAMVTPMAEQANAATKSSERLPSISSSNGAPRGA